MYTCAVYKHIVSIKLVAKWLGSVKTFVLATLICIHTTFFGIMC